MRELPVAPADCLAGATLFVMRTLVLGFLRDARHDGREGALGTRRFLHFEVSRWASLWATWARSTRKRRPSKRFPAPRVTPAARVTLTARATAPRIDSSTPATTTSSANYSSATGNRKARTAERAQATKRPRPHPRALSMQWQSAPTINPFTVKGLRCMEAQDHFAVLGGLGFAEGARGQRR